MANMRPFLIAIAFAIIAVILVYMYVKGVEDQALQPVEMATVVRATANIPPNTTVVESMLEEIQVNKDTVVPGTISELEEILGKVSTTNIFEGVVLMELMFSVESEVERLDRMLEPGMRAVTVGITEISGLGGNITPGDRVDVLVSILSNDEVGVASTFTVLRNVAVMAVGQNIGFDGDMESSGVSKSVTLKVEAVDAQRLALSSEVGSIRLALRDPDDQFAPALGGTPLTDFVSYTPTRQDLEDAAERAQSERMETEQRDHERRIEEMRFYAEFNQSPDFDPSQFGDSHNSLVLPETAPTVTVMLILGGEETIVEVPVPEK